MRVQYRLMLLLQFRLPLFRWRLLVQFSPQRFRPPLWAQISLALRLLLNLPLLGQFHPARFRRTRAIC
jgi:hypothetical protein